MAKKVTLPKVYELKITLTDVKPKVWRHIFVPDFFSLGELHGIIQLAMGWESYHLFQFDIGHISYSPSSEESEFTETQDTDVPLLKALKNVKNFIYIYDMGDYWEHEIEVVSHTIPKKTMRYPICVGGANACPPENVGGTGGYEDFLAAIKNPKDREHKERLVWVGGYFDPRGFNANFVNRLLWMDMDHEEIVFYTDDLEI